MRWRLERLLSLCMASTFAFFFLLFIELWYTKEPLKWSAVKILQGAFQSTKVPWFHGEWLRSVSSFQWQHMEDCVDWKKMLAFNDKSPFGTQPHKRGHSAEKPATKAAVGRTWSQWASIKQSAVVTHIPHWKATALFLRLCKMRNLHAGNKNMLSWMNKTNAKHHFQVIKFYVVHVLPFNWIPAYRRFGKQWHI